MELYNGSDGTEQLWLDTLRTCQRRHFSLLSVVGRQRAVELDKKPQHHIYGARHKGQPLSLGATLYCLLVVSLVSLAGRRYLYASNNCRRRGYVSTVLSDSCSKLTSRQHPWFFILSRIYSVQSRIFHYIYRTSFISVGFTYRPGCYR